MDSEVRNSNVVTHSLNREKTTVIPLTGYSDILISTLLIVFLTLIKKIKIEKINAAFSSFAAHNYHIFLVQATRARYQVL